MDPLAVSITQAAQIIGCGRSKMYELINRGQLETVRIGRRHLVRVSSLRSLVQVGTAADQQL